MLSIFDQSNGEGRNKRVLNIDDSLYHGDADMEHILQRLAMAAGDSKVRQDMNIEEEFISAIERRDTEILHRDQVLAEQRVLLTEQKELLEEQKYQLDEQKNQLDEQKNQLQLLIKMLVQSGKTIDYIAESLHVDKHVVEAIIKLLLCFWEGLCFSNAE